MLPEALLLPIVILAGFRLAGVSRTQACLRRWARVPAAGRELRGDPHRAIVLARRAQRAVKRTLGVEGTCLIRSLTLWTLLLRRGIETDLRVGVRKMNGNVEAHAWLEFQGMPVNDRADVVRSYEAYPKAFSFDDWRQLFDNHSR